MLCRLLHPIMPFVTEDLWQKLPKHADLESRESIMICSYPTAQSAWSSAEVEDDMEYVSTIVAKTRSLRSGVHAFSLVFITSARHTISAFRTTAGHSLAAVNNHFHHSQLQA